MVNISKYHYCLTINMCTVYTGLGGAAAKELWGLRFDPGVIVYVRFLKVLPVFVLDSTRGLRPPPKIEYIDHALSCE